MVSILPTEMSSYRKTYSSNWSCRNSSSLRGSNNWGLERLLPIEDADLTHPENRLCGLIERTISSTKRKMLLSHCENSAFRRRLFLPSRLKPCSNLSIISSFPSSVVATACSATLNSRSWRNFGWSNMAVYSIGNECPQKYLSLRYFNITSSLKEELHTQKDSLRDISDDSKFAFHLKVNILRFLLPDPIRNRIGEWTLSDIVFALRLIFPRWKRANFGNFV